MDSAVQNGGSTMNYSHMPLGDRRDDANGSTPFHQNGLGQALGNHLTAAAVAQAANYNRNANDYRNPSTSPPTLAQPAVNFQGGPTSPAIKRKQIDSSLNAQLSKRRRGETAAAGDDGDAFDMDGGAQGAKHWTDEEKSKLFSWLMGPGQEEHWNALRATKNSCLRECAVQVFGGKKTYQALKGCYERNFNLFKQIYAFENAHGQGNANISALSETDRLREYERRLALARKAGSDVGNITARTIDHWHRVGWYELFYRRWHGDPATMRPIQTRNPNVSQSGMGGNDDGGPDEEDTTLDFNDPSTLNGLNGITHERQHVYINPQDLRENPPPPPPPPVAPAASTSSANMRHQPLPTPPVHHQHPPQQQQQPQIVPPPPPPPPPHMIPGPPPGDNSLMTFALTQDLASRCVQYLSIQTKIAQEKLDILRRREQREINEFNARRDAEKALNRKDKTERAFGVINQHDADPVVKQLATDYLRKFFED